MKTLSVLYNGWGEQFTVGRLAEDRTNLIFEYSQEAINRNLELSPLKLKLGQSSYSGFPSHQHRLPGVIADSLPDGWGRGLMDRIFAKQGQMPQAVSVLDRLARIGDRAMGALSFVPETHGKFSAEEISLLELANEVQDVIAERDTDALQKLAYLGGSPHGTRPKVLVNYDLGTKRVSTETTPSTIPLLVKFPGVHETPESCLLEYCYSRMAIDCGLVMPATFYFPLGGDMAAFGIQRFDRAEGCRVPVLTAAGALDVDFRVPNTDYSTLLSLTGFMTHDAAQVYEAFKRCVFNVLFNNRDDHTKNFAFRMNRAGMWELAPAYDLTFCPGPGECHQMSVMGEVQRPGRKELLKLAAEHRIRTALANTWIDQMIEVASRFAVYANDLGIQKKTVTLVWGYINNNIARCSKFSS